MRSFGYAVSSVTMALVMMSSSAYAQNGSEGDSASAISNSEYPTDSNSGSVEDIVVTGSRITRPELESAMPVSVMNMDQAETMGIISIHEALLRDPAIGLNMFNQVQMARSSFGIA